MSSIAEKIMKKVRGHGRGNWVGTPKDFLDFGSGDAVYKALSRLVKLGKLRRVGRGMYDFPRIIKVLNRPAPTNIDAAVDALKRRDNISIVPDGIVAANRLGLTNAVPARNSYLTDGVSREIKIGKRTLELHHASKDVMIWANRPGAPVVQALHWLGHQVAKNTEVINILRQRISNDVKQDLMKGLNTLPSWMIPIIRQIN
ncbi:MAG: type IV toxin-antitoxin system AbiEi family antitoxin domain-containing protein [Pleurocapsa sp. CRU_1_2]|nr:type IV toxin-antitoxin system AbiEi family antitoxin domain-containing protein [Pleurocapsa sp. CRU_1_2]